MRVHPSENLREYRDSSPHTQKEIAEIMGVTPKTVSLLMNGKARITLRVARGLEVVFKRPAHFWLNLQQNYDLSDEQLKGSIPYIAKILADDDKEFEKAVSYKEGLGGLVLAESE